MTCACGKRSSFRCVTPKHVLSTVGHVQVARQGLEAVGSTPAQYAQHLRDERARYARLIKSAGIRIE